MFLSKYKPKNLEDTIGLKKEALELKKFINAWRKGQTIILSGPQGCGKSLLVELLSKGLGKELVINPDKDNLSSLKQRSLINSGKIILLDDPQEPSYIMEVLEESTFPVITIISDLYNPKYSNLRRKYKVIKFSHIRYDLIGKFMERICKENNIEYERSALYKLARMSDGDVRFALNMLQSINQKIDDKLVKKIDQKPSQENIFNTMKIIFKTSDLENVRIAIRNSEKSPGDLLLWLEENIPKEYKKRREISHSMQFISLSDIFKNRTIKRQAFGLQKYTFNVGIWGTALSKNKKYRSFTKYKTPNMKRIYKQTKNIGNILGKIASQTHTTPRKALVYTGLANQQPELFNLEEEEIEKMEKM